MVCLYPPNFRHESKAFPSPNTGLAWLIYTKINPANRLFGQTSRKIAPSAGF